MFLLRIFFSLLILAASPAQATPSEVAEMNKFIDHLMAQMTIEEKAGQLNQMSGTSTITGPNAKDPSRQDISSGKIGSMLNVAGASETRELQKLAVEKSRLKIPLLFALDIIHGYKTIFPVPLAESSSWDIELMRKTAHIAATEGAADGIHWTFAPMLDIARDARWGRIVEGSGEDPWLGSQIATAKVHGFQGDQPGALDSLLACAKHFVAYGDPFAGRDYNSSQASDRDLLETYFPPFQAAVKAGIASLMPAFSDIGGIPSTSDEHLLKSTLRKQWGFTGLIVTDYTAITQMLDHGIAGDNQQAALLAINASVDIDMVSRAYVESIPRLVKEHAVTIEQIDQPVRRILEVKYKLGLFIDPYRFSDLTRAKKQILTTENRALAREMARRSIVLLKNKDHTLPLKRSGTVALIGPFADNHRDMLGPWAGKGDFRQSVSLLEGVRDSAGEKLKILYAKGANIVEPGPLMDLLNNDPTTPEITLDPRSRDELLNEAINIANRADVIVLALGEAQNMTGEAASRSRLRIPDNQLALLKAMRQLGKPLTLLLYNGRPLILEEENRIVDALVETWFLGTESGHAIADVLFGDFNPTGRLTVSFPINEGQIPNFYNHRPTGRPFDEKNMYTTRYLDAPVEPLFPFGYGLSYTTFSYSSPTVSTKHLQLGDNLQVKVTVTNSGKVAGTETAQLYLREKVASVAWPVKSLKGFEKVSLLPGQSHEVAFKVDPEDLKFYNRSLKRVAESGEFQVFVGSNSHDTKETQFQLTVPQSK